MPLIACSQIAITPPFACYPERDLFDVFVELVDLFIVLFHLFIHHAMQLVFFVLSDTQVPEHSLWARYDVLENLKTLINIVLVFTSCYAHLSSGSSEFAYR